MSRKQIKKDLEELYIGQNVEKLVKEHYTKKKREMFILILAGIAIFLVAIIKEYREGNISDNIIYRNENGEGKKEVRLEVKTKEGDWKKIQLELYDKEYNEQELEKAYIEAIQQIPKLILDQNTSLNHIITDLELVQEIEGFPFVLSWQSSRPEIINSLGQLINKNEITEKTEVELKAFLQYEEWEKEYRLLICVYPKETDDFMTVLSEKVKDEEKKNREQIEFYLPDKIQNRMLQWRYEKGNSWILLGIVLLLCLPLIDYQKDREIHKQIKKRRDELQKQYPEFLSKLILYMEAGMNIRGAIYRIAEDYQGKKLQGKASIYLYEEILYICRQNKNGLSEEECYQLLGYRCNLPSYKKLTGMLIRYLQKGGYGMTEQFREEVLRANEERKKQIKKQGEEMGTKLLLPMIMMLGIVMVLIMVPACFSFQM